MISRAASFLIVFLLMCHSAFAADEARSFPIIYLSRQNDAAYVARKFYEGTILAEKRPPIAGVKTALKEARILGRAMKLTFPLEEKVVPEGESVADTIKTLAVAERNAAFVLDLPVEDMAATAGAFKDRTDLVLFNVRDQNDALRGADCSAAMFHTIASMAMRTDALAQYLYAMNWRNVLVVGSDLPADAAMTASFLRSARKFGLNIAAEKSFIRGNDPRNREKNNPRLITSGADYDAIFVADDQGDFSRSLAYATYLPRPLFGAEGLVASSWHWTFERNGAPQLNQRIRKFAEANPSDEDWAAWAAVHAVVEAVVASKTTDVTDVRKQLRMPGFDFDIYKVGPGSFRPWDQQLRQAMMLHTYNSVIATAPLEGFLHQYNTFDTLGRDAPEAECDIAN